MAVMLHIGHDERGMIEHAHETMNDRIMSEPTEFEDADTRAVLHLDVMGKAETSQLVVTGDEIDVDEARNLMRRVVIAEINNWVPNASQRLVWRASSALEHRVGFRPDHLDCGDDRRQHYLVDEWAAGIFVRRCVTCQRLYWP